MKEQFIPINEIEVEGKIKIPRTGVVIGKFYPPHVGHSFLIDTALSRTESLTVIVCDKEGQEVPGKTRAEWIRENHPDIFIRVINDIYPESDSELWARKTIEWMHYIPEFVFTSEDYGDAYAAHMGSKHVLVDRERQAYPICATDIRKNPRAKFDYLKPNVRRYYENDLRDRR